MILLDTDAISYVIRGFEPYLSEFRNLEPGDWGISSLVAYELGFGIRLKQTQVNPVVEEFLKNAQTYSFDNAAAQIAADLAAQLSKAGKTIDRGDLMIAAHAISLDAVLVSNNVKHFNRVPGLNLVTWSSQ